MKQCFNSCNESTQKLAMISTLSMYQCVAKCPVDYPLVENGMCKKLCVSFTYENDSVSEYPVCVSECKANKTRSLTILSHMTCVRNCDHG